MNAVAEMTAITPETLLAMPDEKDFELVKGELVERNMGSMSSWVASELLFLLRYYLKDHPIGLVFGADNGFQCFPDDPRKVRKPDVSFVRGDRLPGGIPPEGYLKVAPDLAVEVLSPNDLAIDVDRKVAEYLGAGVGLVWVVNPDVRIVRAHRPGGASAWLTEHDQLVGDDVLPGFSISVAALFPARPGGAPPARS